MTPERLRQLQKRLGISAQLLAYLAGATPSSAHRWLRLEGDEDLKIEPLSLQLLAALELAASRAPEPKVFGRELDQLRLCHGSLRAIYRVLGVVYAEAV